MTHVVGKPAPSSQCLKQPGHYTSNPGHNIMQIDKNCSKWKHYSTASWKSI